MPTSPVRPAPYLAACLGQSVTDRTHTDDAFLTTRCLSLPFVPTALRLSDLKPKAGGGMA